MASGERIECFDWIVLQSWLEERGVIWLDSMQRLLEEGVVLWLDSLQR